MTPVPVETTVPTGMGLLSVRYSVSSSNRRLIRSVPTDSSKMTCPSRSITQRTSKLYGSGQLVARHEHRAKHGTTVENLRLRQVERIFALDVPRRDVVADRVADELAVRAEHVGQLGFRHRDRRVGADGRGGVGTDAARVAALGEDFGARCDS